MFNFNELIGLFYFSYLYIYLIDFYLLRILLIFIIYIFNDNYFLFFNVQ